MFVYQKKLQYRYGSETRTEAGLCNYFPIWRARWRVGRLPLRYLSQQYAMPYPELKGLLTDIGTEELGHLEMIGAIIHQLPANSMMNRSVRQALTPTLWTIPPVFIRPQLPDGHNAASMAVKAMSSVT